MVKKKKNDIKVFLQQLKNMRDEVKKIPKQPKNHANRLSLIKPQLEDFHVWTLFNLKQCNLQLNEGELLE